MMTRKVLVLVAAVLACLAFGQRRASAACTISVSGVAFGAYDVFDSTALDSTGSVMFECDKPDKRIRITFSTGTSGSYTARTMRQGADLLLYNLYIWGLT